MNAFLNKDELSGRQQLIYLIAEAVATEITHESVQATQSDSILIPATVKQKNEVYYLRPLQHRQATRIVNR